MATPSLKAEYWKYLIPVYKQVLTETFGTEFETSQYERQKHRFMQQMSYIGTKNLKSLIYPLVLLRGVTVREITSQQITVYVLSYAYELTRAFHIAFGGRQKMMKPVCETGTVFNTGITLFDRALDSPENTETLKSIISYDYLLELISRKHQRKKDYSHFTEKPLVQVVIALVNEYFIRCHEFFEISKRVAVWEEHTESLLTLFLAAVKGIEYSFKTHVPVQETCAHVLERALAFSKILALDSFLSPDSDSDLFRQDVLDPILDLGKVFVIIDDIRDVPDDIQRGLWSYVILKGALNFNVQVLEDGKRRAESEILEDMLSTEAITQSLQDMFSFYTNSLETLEEFIPSRRVYPLRNLTEKILTYSMDLREEDER
ncbi:MAG: hypothetical protein AYK18_13610 [Theionarchaea archaeon DG-70]|nr:MAG: hypothetical protein AYK18_13610 [Theionarchaea archaeon DG-70]